MFILANNLIRKKKYALIDSKIEKDMVKYSNIMVFKYNKLSKKKVKSINYLLISYRKRFIK